MGDWRPRLSEELRDAVLALADGRPLELLAARAVTEWVERQPAPAPPSPKPVVKRVPKSEVPTVLPAEPRGVPLPPGVTKGMAGCPHRREWETKTSLMVVCDEAKGGCGHRIR